MSPPAAARVGLQGVRAAPRCRLQAGRPPLRLLVQTQAALAKKYYPLNNFDWSSLCEPDLEVEFKEFDFLQVVLAKFLGNHLVRHPFGFYPLLWQEAVSPVADDKKEWTTTRNNGDRRISFSLRLQSGLRSTSRVEYIGGPRLTVNLGFTSDHRIKYAKNVLEFMAFDAAGSSELKIIEKNFLLQGQPSETYYKVRSLPLEEQSPSKVVGFVSHLHPGGERDFGQDFFGRSFPLVKKASGD